MLNKTYYEEIEDNKEFFYHLLEIKKLIYVDKELGYYNKRIDFINGYIRSLKKSMEFDEIQKNLESNFATGVLCLKNCNYKKALERFEIMLQSKNLKESKTFLFNCMFETYLSLGYDKKLIDFYELNLKKDEKSFSNEELASFYNDLGLAYINLGQLNDACEILNNSLNLNIDEKSVIKDTTYHRMAIYYYYNNQIKKMRKILNKNIKKSYDALKSPKNLEYLADAYIIEALLLSKLNNIDEAIEYCKKLNVMCCRNLY